MTQKQTARLHKKIEDIRQTLAYEERTFGCINDSRGLRYLPPELYVKLGYYEGGLAYCRWFDKNFPDDCGFPNFLFEWTIILVMTGKLKEAEQKAFQTFCSNTYLFDKFFGNPIIPIDKQETSNWENASHTEYFHYSSNQPELADFTSWLKDFIATEKFVALSKKYLSVQERLNTERDMETRGYLAKQSMQLKYEW